MREPRDNKKLILKKIPSCYCLVAKYYCSLVAIFLKITSQVMLLILWFDGIKLHIGSFTTPNTTALPNMVLSANMVKL